MGGRGSSLRSNSASGASPANSRGSIEAIRAQEAIEEMSPRAARAVRRIADGDASDAREVLQDYSRRIADVESRGRSERNSFRRTALAQELVQLKRERDALDEYFERF